MSLAGRLISRKDSAVGKAFAAVLGAKGPIWTPREYARMAKEGYEANTWVYACVTGTCDATKQIPWSAYAINDAAIQNERSRRLVKQRVKFLREHPQPDSHHQIRRMKALGQLEEVPSHPILGLLSNPNPLMSGAEFKDAYFGYLLLSGNSYVEAVQPVSSRPPVELWPQRPDRIKVIPGDGAFRVSAYRYTVSAKYVDLPAESVMHSKFFHPTNDWYGLSPIEAAAMAVDRDNAAESWNTALLQNGARPSGALVAEGELGEEQRLDLREAIDERANPRAAGRPLLLEGGLSWQEMGLTPRDMDWLNSQVWSMKRIAAAFHYPLLLLDPELGGSFSTDYKEARRALYADRAIPLFQHMCDDLNRWLVPKFGENIILSYDTDNLEALREGEDSIWTRTNDPRLSMNERREAVGMDPLPNGDVYLIPTNVTRVPVADLDTPEPAPAPMGGSTPDDAVPDNQPNDN